MAISPFRLDVGKIRSTGAKYPWEPGYIKSIRTQLDDLQKAMKAIVASFENTTPEICMEALRPTFEKSKVYCPKDTGLLVSSAYLEIAGFRGQRRVEMGYARGGNPHYAVVVHENLEMKHKSPTRAKWLEVAVAEDLIDIMEGIAEGMAKFWQSADRR
jgi:hypothetical protein